MSRRRNMERKQVTYKQLKKGQEIREIRGENETRMLRAYVKDINPSYVTVELWKPGGMEEKISTSNMFGVEMTEKEFEDKYRKRAREILKNIGNKLALDEIGYHEMWNGWLYGTPYEMAAYCAKEKIRAVGHSTDITPKNPMFSNDILDVGVCAEYENGERFWCHYRSRSIENMKEVYKELLE